MAGYWRTVLCPPRSCLTGLGSRGILFLQVSGAGAIGACFAVAFVCDQVMADLVWSFLGVL
jgi:hypothetical protein